ncbi:MAG: class I SAM-dependent methyltransferase [Nocardiaceae bacterium]|nr:class I SAM-dependent methyltransferase [Nocardiaceae bacterium]
MTRPAAIPFAEALGISKLKIKAFDGSAAGADVPIGICVNRPRAAADLLHSPGELGLARAFAAGDMTVFGVPEGDPYEVLAELEDMGDRRPPPSAVLGLGMVAGRDLLHRSPRLEIEMPPRWRRLKRGLRHSKARDAEAIRHHYDVSNEFYANVLGPSMTYTCAVFDTKQQSLTDAQENKYRLVFDKLALQPGDRLLDVGCGWGGMVRYAAEHGVRTLGVTLSKPQAEWGQRAIEEAGLGHLAEVRYLDYRDVDEDDFDAVSSIGLTEHIGLANYPDYFRFLASRLRDGGLLLNHCITRPDNHWGSHPGGFMDRFIFPDAELASPGRVVSAIHDNGFEVRHEENLREHYALTLSHWNHNLAAHWNECVAEAGISTCRIWAIYLAGSRLGFEQNDLQLHQVLAVKGRARLPMRPWWKP